MNCDHNHHNSESKALIQANIDQYGCHLIMIGSDNYLPGFVYSIGLYQKFTHPEIICFGLKTSVMATLINHAKDLLQAGGIILPGKYYNDFLEGYSIQFIEVNKEFYPDYFGYAGWFYGSNAGFPALQIVWPDKQNKFPWEEKFNPDLEFKQLLLDRDIDFKFYEKKSLGVYTTQQALEGDPVLFVYHNEDGDWQFHTSLSPDLDNAKLVFLEQLVKRDPTLNEIYHLQYGWSASRLSINAEWKLQAFPDKEIEE